MSDPAFMFYPKDWVTSTAEMMPEEKGVYIDLLCYQHQQGSLPTDVRRLAKIVSLTVEEFAPIWETVKLKFKQVEMHMDNHMVNRLVNGRLIEEVEKRKRLAHRKRIAGELAGCMKSLKLTEKQRQQARFDFKVDDFEHFEADELKEKITTWLTICITKCIPFVGSGSGSVIENKDIDVIDEKGVQGEKRELPEHLIADIPNKVNEFADLALRDNRLFESVRKSNSKINEKNYIELVERFRERQLHCLDYYHVYQQFKRHLLNSPLLTEFEPITSQAKTKSGQALRTDLLAGIEYDEHGNMITK